MRTAAIGWATPNPIPIPSPDPTPTPTPTPDPGSDPNPNPNQVGGRGDQSEEGWSRTVKLSGSSL